MTAVWRYKKNLCKNKPSSISTETYVRQKTSSHKAVKIQANKKHKKQDIKGRPTLAMNQINNSHKKKQYKLNKITKQEKTITHQTLYIA